MRMKEVLQHLVIAVYITMTLAGFSYTLFRYWLPGVPLPLAIFSYGMMAPFQGYRDFNEELVAEGRTATGDWEQISLRPYLPFVRGERAHRSYLVGFRYHNMDVTPQYRNYAYALQRIEAKQGREWQSIRMSLQKWPKSPAGYEYLRIPLFSEESFLVQIP